MTFSSQKQQVGQQSYLITTIVRAKCLDNFSQKMVEVYRRCLKERQQVKVSDSPWCLQTLYTLCTQLLKHEQYIQIRLMPQILVSVTTSERCTFRSHTPFEEFWNFIPKNTDNTVSVDLPLLSFTPPTPSDQYVTPPTSVFTYYCYLLNSIQLTLS